MGASKQDTPSPPDDLDLSVGPVQSEPLPDQDAPKARQASLPRLSNVLTPRGVQVTSADGHLAVPQRPGPARFSFTEDAEVHVANLQDQDLSAGTPQAQPESEDVEVSRSTNAGSIAVSDHVVGQIVFSNVPDKSGTEI